MRRVVRSWRRMPRGERGVVLIIMLVILILGGAYFLVGNLNDQMGKRRDTEQQDAVALAKAKEILIAWAVNNATMPGMFPYPDRNNDGDYDGRSDCPGPAAPAPNLLMGKLPTIGTDAPCLGGVVAVGLDTVDSSGESLWYAVSRNLVATNTTAPTINPNLLNGNTFSWLRIVNAQGAIISDRVAAVIIAPGKAFSDPSVPINQSRAGAAGATNFLDQFTVGAVPYVNSDFDGSYDSGAACPTSFCEDFIAADSTTAFNDRIAFVTIDELMPLIERRVVGEVRMRLQNYYAANSRYPFAAALGDATGACVPNNSWGFVPLVAGGTCTPFPAPFLTGFPAWYPPPPGGSGWQNFIYYAVASACMPPSVACNNPAPNNTFLTVGSTANVRAVVVSRGSPLNGTTCQPEPPPGTFNQAGAPSVSVCDYLDDNENTNGDQTYTAEGAALSPVFNDQSVIVAP